MREREKKNRATLVRTTTATTMTAAAAAAVAASDCEVWCMCWQHCEIHHGPEAESHHSTHIAKRSHTNTHTHNKYHHERQSPVPLHGEKYIFTYTHTHIGTLAHMHNCIYTTASSTALATPTQLAVTPPVQQQI